MATALRLAKRSFFESRAVGQGGIDASELSAALYALGLPTDTVQAQQLVTPHVLELDYSAVSLLPAPVQLLFLLFKAKTVKCFLHVVAAVDVTFDRFCHSPACRPRSYNRSFSSSPS